MNAVASCGQFHKLYGVLNLESKKWTTNLIDSPETFCDPFPKAHNPNIEITLKKKKQVYTTEAFSSLDEYWDHPKDGKFEGGKRPNKILDINVFIPAWYKGSTLTIRHKSSNKVLKEVKL